MSRRQFLSGAGLAAISSLTACGSPASQITPKAGGQPAPSGLPLISPPATLAPPTPIPPAVVPAIGPYLANRAVTDRVVLTHCFGNLAAFQSVLASFGRLYPGLTVEETPVSCADLEVPQALAAGQAGDALLIQSSDLPALVGPDGLRPLDSLLTTDRVRPEQMYYPTEIALHRLQSQTLSLPLLCASGWHYLWWKPADLTSIGWDAARIPATWDDLDQIAGSLHAKRPGEVFLDPSHAFGLPSFLLFLYGNGGSLLDSTGQHVAINSDAGRQALEWLLAFVHRQADHYDDFADRTVPADTEQTVETLASGRFGASIGGYWRGAVFQQNAALGGERVAPFPFHRADATSKPATPAIGSWGFGIPRSAHNPDGAWEWVKFIGAGEGNHQFNLTTNRPAPIRAYNADPAYSAANPQWAQILADFDRSVPLPVFRDQRSAMRLLVAMTGEVLEERAAPQAALDATAAKIQALL